MFKPVVTFSPQFTLALRSICQRGLFRPPGYSALTGLPGHRPVMTYCLFTRHRFSEALANLLSNLSFQLPCSWTQSFVPSSSWGTQPLGDLIQPQGFNGHDCAEGFLSPDWIALLRSRIRNAPVSPYLSSDVHKSRFSLLYLLVPVLPASIMATPLFQRLSQKPQCHP